MFTTSHKDYTFQEARTEIQKRSLRLPASFDHTDTLHPLAIQGLALAERQGIKIFTQPILDEVFQHCNPYGAAMRLANLSFKLSSEEFEAYKGFVLQDPKLTTSASIVIGLKANNLLTPSNLEKACTFPDFCCSVIELEHGLICNEPDSRRNYSWIFSDLTARGLYNETIENLMLANKRPDLMLRELNGLVSSHNLTSETLLTIFQVKSSSQRTFSEREQSAGSPSQVNVSNATSVTFSAPKEQATQEQHPVISQAVPD